MNVVSTLNGNIANMPKMDNGNLGSKYIAVGKQNISFDTPVSLSGKTIYMIMLYCSWDDIYFQWEPQTGVPFSFCANNLRSADVTATNIRYTALYL